MMKGVSLQTSPELHDLLLKTRNAAIVNRIIVGNHRLILQNISLVLQEPSGKRSEKELGEKEGECKPDFSHILLIINSSLLFEGFQSYAAVLCAKDLDNYYEDCHDQLEHLKG